MTNTIRRKNSVARPRSASQAGFSLIEVMVVGGIMLTLGLGAATLMDQQSRQFKNLRTYANRDALVADLKSQTKQLYMLYNSVGGVVAHPTEPGRLHPDEPNVNIAMAAVIGAGNQELYNCLWGTGACSTTTNNPVVTSRWRDFYMVPTTAPSLDRNNAIGGPPGSFALDTTPGSYSFSQIAGPGPGSRPGPGVNETLVPEPAVRFDQNGRRCAASETVGVCPNVVRTQFQVACKAGAVTCVHEQIQQFNFRFVVHNLLSGQTTPQGVVPAMRDKIGQGEVTWEQIENSLNGSPPQQDCVAGLGEVRVSRDGAPTTVCARARDQDITTCIAPRVLRVGPNAAGNATQLHCEDPFPGNTTATYSVTAPSTAGACDSPLVVSGIAQDGSVRCDLPLKRNGTTDALGAPTNDSMIPGGAISGGGQGYWGACLNTPSSRLVVRRVNANGMVECMEPLPFNRPGNVLNTANQSATRGQCPAEFMVTSINRDGSVECKSRELRCHTRRQPFIATIGPDSSRTESVTCFVPTRQRLTGYAVDARHAVTSVPWPVGVRWHGESQSGISAEVGNFGTNILLNHIRAEIVFTCCEIGTP